jgi:hypothetical protein
VRQADKGLSTCSIQAKAETSFTSAPQKDISTRVCKRSRTCCAPGLGYLEASSCWIHNTVDWRKAGWSIHHFCEITSHNAQRSDNGPRLCNFLAMVETPRRLESDLLTRVHYSLTLSPKHCRHRTRFAGQLFGPGAKLRSIRSTRRSASSLPKRGASPGGKAARIFFSWPWPATKDPAINKICTER